MVDPRDLGLVTQVRSPHSEQPTIYLYEAVPAGVGLSERLWDRHDELLSAAAGPHRAVAARRAAPPAPDRVSNPTSTPERLRCGCSRSSGAPVGASVAVARP